MNYYNYSYYTWKQTSKTYPSSNFSYMPVDSMYFYTILLHFHQSIIPPTSIFYSLFVPQTIPKILQPAQDTQKKGKLSGNVFPTSFVKRNHSDAVLVVLFFLAVWFNLLRHVKLSSDKLILWRPKISFCS